MEEQQYCQPKHQQLMHQLLLFFLELEPNTQKSNSLYRHKFKLSIKKREKVFEKKTIAGQKAP
jgi:hypothetical protein